MIIFTLVIKLNLLKLRWLFIFYYIWRYMDKIYMFVPTPLFKVYLFCICYMYIYVFSVPLYMVYENKDDWLIGRDKTMTFFCLPICQTFPNPVFFYNSPKTYPHTVQSTSYNCSPNKHVMSVKSSLELIFIVFYMPD
jgi:hypothetical protein